MQLRNIRPFSQHKPGDLVEVPDGAAFDPFHYELAEQPGPAGAMAAAAASAMTQVAADIRAAQPAVAAALASAPRLPIPPKEM